MIVGLKTQILPAGEAAVAAAARALSEGGLVAFPTETVYGLGADATNPAAIARLYQAKGRPAFNPLIAHVGDLAAARQIARFDAAATALAEAFWPGPLTLVLPKTEACAVADLATAGLDTVAVRIPAHSIAHDILREFGGPVVAPSANISGHVSPTTAAHVQSDLAAARQIARFDAAATALAEAFWPGPLTLVLPKTEACAVADLATAGLDTVAVRIPAHSIAHDILREFGGPVVAPSANISGHVSPTTAAHVQSDLAGRIDLIVDGGAVEVGVESTILGCFDEPMLLRPGGLPRAEIERVLGRALVQPPADTESENGQPLAPGMLASHYAPRARVRLNAVAIEPGEALLAFGLGAISGIDAASHVMNLSERGDLDEAAANLFGHLRALDSKGARTIAVMPIPDEGLGEAINDRLRRAAVGRE